MSDNVLKPVRHYTRRNTKPIDKHFIKHTYEEYNLAYELLELLGYDITKNIHRQFCEKHNFVYDDKKKRRVSMYNKKYVD
jgi:hypothetical protein